MYRGQLEPKGELIRRPILSQNEEEENKEEENKEEDSDEESEEESEEDKSDEEEEDSDEEDSDEENSDEEEDEERGDEGKEESFDSDSDSDSDHEVTPEQPKRQKSNKTKRQKSNENIKTDIDIFYLLPGEKGKHHEIKNNRSFMLVDENNRKYLNEHEEFSKYYIDYRFPGDINNKEFYFPIGVSTADIEDVPLNKVGISERLKIFIEKKHFDSLILIKKSLNKDFHDMLFNHVKNELRNVKLQSHAYSYLLKQIIEKDIERIKHNGYDVFSPIREEQTKGIITHQYKYVKKKIKTKHDIGINKLLKKILNSDSDYSKNIKKSLFLSKSYILSDKNYEKENVNVFIDEKALTFLKTFRTKYPYYVRSVEHGKYYTSNIDFDVIKTSTNLKYDKKNRKIINMNDIDDIDSNNYIDVITVDEIEQTILETDESKERVEDLLIIKRQLENDYSQLERSLTDVQFNYKEKIQLEKDVYTMYYL